jgi:hypothetical protein
VPQRLLILQNFHKDNHVLENMLVGVLVLGAAWFCVRKLRRVHRGGDGCGCGCEKCGRRER